MTLHTFFEAYPRVALAFSGGTDSSLLLKLAHDAGAQVQPYFIRSAFQPAFELEDARRLAKELGVELAVLELDVLGCPQVAENTAQRCYHCKTALFSALLRRAKEDGFDAVIDGTNASDDAGDRPGMRALRELGVLSPLRLCGITKPEVRRLSEELGLFTAQKPAYACLATRVPTGEPITAEKLEKVEAAEGKLFELGFTDFRVRLFRGAARIQLRGAQMERAISMRETICGALSPWFTDILLDLRER